MGEIPGPFTHTMTRPLFKKKDSTMDIHKLRFAHGLHLSVFPVSLFSGHEDVESLNKATTLCFCTCYHLSTKSVECHR